MKCSEINEIAEPSLDDSGSLSVQRSSHLLKELIRVLATAMEAIESKEESDVFQETDFYDAVRHFEVSLIRKALDRAAGNQAKAARMLHLKQTTLHGKIKQYKIYQTITVRQDDE
jgi:transcriptional regulator with GAF, ATPase, and Fis domain